MQNSLNSLKSLGENQKKIVREIILSVMNLMVKSESQSLALIESEKNSNPQMNFIYVVLNERNKPVIAEITNNPANNYVVVYGSLHFDGILK